MTEIKFTCPHCQQHIAAEPSYAGVQIQCPTCQAGIIVPGEPPASVPSEVPPLRPPPPAADGCPSCGSALPRGAVLCTQCGYNLATGQRMVAGRAVAPGKPGAPQWETPWFKTAYPYLGLLALSMGLLYYLGRSNPKVMVAFFGAAVLYSLTMHIIVVVAAFREGVGTGFLTLCVPFYALYFVFKVCDSPTLKILYSVAVVINLLVRFLSRQFE